VTSVTFLILFCTVKFLVVSVQPGESVDYRSACPQFDFTAKSGMQVEFGNDVH
jgi:hypothetical protein